MFTKRYKNIELLVSDASMENMLIDPKVAESANKKELQDLIREQVVPDAFIHERYAAIVLDKEVILASNDTHLKKKFPVFEVITYSGDLELQGCLHGVLVDRAAAFYPDKFNGIKLYSILPEETKEAIIKPFLDLPIIDHNQETGLITENMHACPVIYGLCLSSDKIKAAHYISPHPNKKNVSLVTTNIFFGSGHIEIPKTENGAVEEVFQRYLAYTQRNPEEFVVRVPTAACVGGCAQTRQKLAY